jgi:putative redox protein
MSETTLKASLKGGYTVANFARDHQWYADEPIEQGGQDEGPMPTELLLSALAGCKIITVKMYANRKGWEIDDVLVELSLGEKGETTIIEKSIEIIGDIDEKQRKRLIDISGRCPVAKMLSNSIEFKIV